MKKYMPFLFLLITFSMQAQKKYTISGYLSDAASGEKLIAASVFDTLSLEGTVSNNFGFFSLTLDRGPVVLEVSYLGHQKIHKSFNLRKDVEIDFELNAINELETIEIVGSTQTSIEKETQMSKIEVPVEQIKKIPALLGEVDVLKTLQLLPGVQSGGEGQSGLYIRGGSPDQNLILLDGVPVYNVSHLLGIFSVFNADAIKNVTLTKGGFPARYGGRLSSVVEINMKDGHKNEFHGEGSVGLISSRLTLEGPIIKDKTSFLISGRRTYWDVIFTPIIERAASYEDDDFKMDLDLYFYDLNAKINHKFNDRHRLYLSAYSGADVFGTSYTDTYNDFSDKLEAGIDWGNFVSSLRWNYKMSNKLFANTTLTYSQYDLTVGSALEEEYEVENEIQYNRFEAHYLSGIEDLGGKVDFDYYPAPNHFVKFGASATHHTYSPGAIAFQVEDNEFALDTVFGHDDNYSIEYDLYIEDDMKFGALKANVGLHASAFQVDDEFYKSLQPRVNLRYLMANDFSLKASFATMTQYLNLLTSEALALPSDLWVPSTASIKPQKSWQVALGFAKTFRKDYEISLEGYYKGMNNVISYKPGESFLTDFIDAFGDTEWESKITQGTGESYGAELFFQKKKGKTTGWIGYTLAWNWRKFDDINGGERFPFRYDRRHDFSIVVSHQFNEKFTLSGTWVYGTGNAITLPTYKYLQPSKEYNYYQPYFEGLGDKNGYRMTDYHRLDISLEIKTSPKWGESYWTFGVYNAYWHKNPYFVIRDDEYDWQTGESEVKFKEISILPFIPHIAYNFKF